jgi:uncharacterized protein
LRFSIEQHVHHWVAHEWWAANNSFGWATCPLTENGLVRIISQPAYQNPINATFAIQLLTEQVERTDHAFWPDDISLRDDRLIASDRILRPNQITDVYLFALAVKNDGRLVTFDKSVPLEAVRGALPRHLATI